MSISIHNIEEDNGILNFQIRNCNVSIANAIRRTILTDIPTVIIRSSPYEKSDVQIFKNNTRLNNEILKHRLSCIPIHIQDLSLPLENYTLEIKAVNNTDSIMNITTKDFKIKNNETNNYLSDNEVHRIFPPNNITKDYILFTRLLPKISENIEAEHIHIEAKMTISTANEDSMFNVVSICSYSMDIDEIKQRESWTQKEKTLRKQGLNKDEIKLTKQNWLLLDGKRYIKKDTFNFTIESIGVFENSYLVKSACDVLKQKLQKIITLAQQQKINITPATTIQKAFDIKLENEGYTIGKALEYILYNNYYLNKNELAFVAFRKSHPHDEDSFIRLAFKDESKDKINIFGLLSDSCNILIDIFDNINSNF